MRGIALAFLLPCITAIPSAAAETGSRDNPHKVTRATSEIIIDGAIDEPAWDDALSLELEYEIRPGENVKPPVRTVLLITYDEHRVLVAFRAFDPEPERIRARYRDRDHMPTSFTSTRWVYSWMRSTTTCSRDSIYRGTPSGSLRAA